MPATRARVWVLVALLGLLGAFSAFAADTLNWDTNKNRVSADIKSSPLLDVLKRVASATGWQVFVEPETLRTVSAKFKDLPPGEALRLLLGDVNFALLPGTNASARLFVFRTGRQNATQEVEPGKLLEGGAEAKLIPNELVVRLKPGAKIDELAQLLGAKVVGRIDGLNAYRLRFEDEAGAKAAREQLASNSDVLAVDSNYIVDVPPSPRELGMAPVAPPRLQLKPPPENGRVIVGLIDTAVQPLGNNLDQFLLKQVSVVGEAAVTADGPSHGTAMAETILRSLETFTKGSTSVQILPVNIYPGPTGVGDAATSTFEVASGITQAVNGGAKVVNLSLGSTSDSPFLHSVIQDVSKLGILVFAAAGNEPVTTPTYPAAYPEVGAVTAIDQGQVAPYANRGSFISLGASGNSVVYYNGQPFSVVGTSTATAYISGAIAGYMDANRVSASDAKAFINNHFGVKITSTSKQN